MDKYILNADGEPEVCNDVLTWGKWFEANNAQRVVAKDDVSDTVRVSTVFLGLDHAFGHGGPLLYETMIFGGEHDGFQERYGTRAEAEAGHRTALALAQSAGAVDPHAGSTGTPTPRV